MAAPLSAGAPGTAGIVKVSNPSNDIAFSSFGGFTQSETSTARCGNQVVAGFNDSGSVFETPFFFTGTGGQAFSGAAYSTNGGASFTDIGPMNPGTTDGNFLGGDPDVPARILTPSTFHLRLHGHKRDFFAAISVNQSADGGKPGTIQSRQLPRMASPICSTNLGRPSTPPIQRESLSLTPTSIPASPVPSAAMTFEPRSSSSNRMTAETLGRLRGLQSRSAVLPQFRVHS